MNADLPGVGLPPGSESEPRTPSRPVCDGSLPRAASLHVSQGAQVFQCFLVHLGGYTGGVDIKRTLMSIRWLLVAVFLILVIDVLWGVASRYLLGSQASWSEELARLLMVWLALLGAPSIPSSRVSPQDLFNLLGHLTIQRDSYGRICSILASPL